MNESNLSRRDLLARSVAGITAAALPLWYEREAIAAEREWDAAGPRRAGANDRINVACVGPGGSRYSTRPSGRWPRGGRP